MTARTPCLVALLLSLTWPATAALAQSDAYAQSDALARESVVKWRAFDTEAKRFLAEGRLDLAERYMRRALDMTRALALDDPRRATAMNNLAHSLAIQGAFEEAGELYLDAWAQRRAIHGDDDPLTLQTLEDLAMLEMREERPATAAAHLRLVREGYERNGQLDQSARLRLTFAYATALVELGDIEMAQAEIEALPDDHPGVIGLRARLSQKAADVQPALEDREAFLDRTIALVEQRQLPDRSALALALNQRALIAYESGDAARAAGDLERAISLFEEDGVALFDMLDTERTAHVMSLRNLASVRLAENDMVTAAGLLERARGLDAGASEGFVAADDYGGERIWPDDSVAAPVGSRNLTRERP